MQARVLGLAALLALPPLAVWAAGGDPDAGRVKAQTCGACHGQNGISTMRGVPSLAGQTDQFLQWQLVFYRSGRRQNTAMSPFAAELSDEDVRNLGAWYSRLPRNAEPAAISTDANLLAKGKALAEQHHCAVCHSDDFRGKAAAASIADQREDYLIHALADYRSGARPSTGVAAMTEAAAGLNDEDISALAHYLASL